MSSLSTVWPAHVHQSDCSIRFAAVGKDGIEQGVEYLIKSNFNVGIV